LSAVAVTCTGCPAAPTVRLSDAGDTASEKSACVVDGATTVMAKEAVWVRLPEVPVSVAVEDPAAVPVGAVRVSVAAVPGVRVMGDGCAVTPAGKPAIATCTLPENPFCAVARRDTVAGAPSAVTFTDDGVVLRVKLGVAASTVSEAWVLAVCPFTVVLNVTVAVAAVADEAAVNVSGSAVPGVADKVEGEIVTPVGRPDTVIVAAPAPAGAASSREAGCALVPTVRLMVEGVSASVAAV
jgi:hypothetical protein